MKDRATRVLKNAKVYTVNEKQPWAEALVIKDNIIAFTGTDAEAQEYIGPGTEVTDMKGKMVLPGFIDGHCHTIMASYWLSGMYFEYEWSLEEVLEEIRSYIEAHPEEKAYVGIGYNEILFDEKGPNRAILDEICSDKPVFILSSSGHVGWCNSRTLELAGINRDTPDPVPGAHFFQRDDRGEPTGYIVETKAEDRIWDRVKFYDMAKVSELFIQFSEEYAAAGVTAICDMGMMPYMYPFFEDLMPGIIEQGSFKQRFFGCQGMCFGSDTFEPMLWRCIELRKKHDSDSFRINHFKYLNDGTLETRSAALSEPYIEDGSMVRPYISAKELSEQFIRIAEAGLDIHVHAIGDAAIHCTLEAAAATRQAGYTDTRITNAHTDYAADEDIDKFGKYNVIADSTGVWMYHNPDMERVIGDRQNNIYRIGSIIRAGGRFANGTDFPVDEMGKEPLKSLECLCTRQLPGRPQDPVLKPENERLKLEDAIRGLTINNAYQEHMEDKLGTIEPGKYADLVVLEENLFEVPLHHIHQVKVMETICNGRTIYRAE